MIISTIADSGKILYATIERLSDEFFLHSSENTFQSSIGFLNRRFSMSEGSGVNAGSYRVSVNSEGWRDGSYFIRIHEEDGDVIGGELSYTKNGKETFPADEDVYFAEIQYLRNQISSTDEYTVTWFKNSTMITSGISSVNLKVVRRSNGVILINNKAMVEVSGTGIYKLDALTTERQSAGQTYLVVSTMTLNGQTYTYSAIVGRDAI